MHRLADTNRYEDVRAVHVNQLALVLSRADENYAKTLCEKIDEKIDCFANGDLDHAEDAITHLFKLSKAGGQSTLVPPDEVFPVSPRPCYLTKTYP